MKNKIVFFMPLIGTGGVEKNLFVFSKFLSKKNDVFICTSSKKFKYKFDKKVNFILPKKGFKNSYRQRLHYIVCLYSLFIFLIKNKNSIVISFQGNVYCVLLCKLLGIKILVRSNSSPTGWEHGFFKRFIYSRIMKKADSFLVNSLSFKKQIKNVYGIKATSIYNPVDSKDILKKAKEKKRINFFGKKNKSLHLINIGRLTDQKDQMTLLKAINSIKDKINIKLIIIGEGENKKKLENYININNLKKNIKILNFIQNPYPLIKSSDIFILSSKFEGLPNVLLEATILKKYIISTNCPTGPSEIIKDKTYGVLFKIGDFYSLSREILFYSKNKKKINKKIKMKNIILDNFNFKKNLIKFENLVNKINY